MRSANIFGASIIGLFETDKNFNKALVYLVDIEKYAGNKAQFWYYLSAEEKKQAKKYYTTLLADKYVISHGILRCILSYHIKQPAQSLEFIHNKYGKPFCVEVMFILICLTHIVWFAIY